MARHNYSQQSDVAQPNWGILGHTASQNTPTDQALLTSHEAHHEVLMRLAIAGQHPDQTTLQHNIRLAYMAGKLSSLLGEPDEFCDLMRLAAPMHDVGNLGIPEAILNKPGALSPAERAIMNRHTEIGHHILSQADTPLFQLAASIALSHHEKFDGTGYPYQLAAYAIPLAARIIALVDCFDALTMHKPYRAAFTDDQAIKMLASQTGQQFDPDILAVFMAHIECFQQLRLRINTSPEQYSQLLNYSHTKFMWPA